MKIVSYKVFGKYKGYSLFGGFITIILYSDNWLISFWIGDIIRGGIRKPSEYFGLFNLWIGNRLILDSQDRGYRNISERFPKTPVKFIGWIYGNPKDRPTLQSLGVEGEMKWKTSDNNNKIQPFAETKNGIFEHCIITMEVAKRLRDNYPAFPPQTFTGIDKDGNQTIHQPLWKGEYEN